MAATSIPSSSLVQHQSTTVHSPAIPPLQTVPFPREQEPPITQAQLVRIIGLRNTISALKANLEAAESEVKTALQNCASIEPGVHVAQFKITVRRTPAWKDVVVRLADRLYGDGQGEPYCARVLASTKPTSTTSLVVS